MTRFLAMPAALLIIFAGIACETEQTPAPTQTQTQTQTQTSTSTSTSTPRPAATAACPTAAEREWMNTLGKHLPPSAEALTNLGTLSGAAAEDNSLFFSTTWKNLVAAELVVLQMNSDAMLAMVPPTNRLRPAQDAINAMARDIQSAIQNYILGVDNLDANAITRANENLTSGTQHGVRANTLIRNICD